MTQRNFDLNADTILRDLYRLAVLVLGDGQLFGNAAADDALIELRDRFIDDEIVHLLISTAIMNRIQDEHMWHVRNDPDEVSFSPITRICGSIQSFPDGHPGPNQQLSFREATNKIVHALRIYVETDGGPQGAGIGRIIALRGELYGVEWRAELNILDYIRAGVENFR